MKTLFRNLTIALFSACALNTSAQGILVQGGLNLSHLTIKMDGDVDNEGRKFQPGFQVGMLYELPTRADNFVFVPGILFSSKGTRVKIEESLFGETFKATTKINLYYLEMPLTARYYFDAGSARMYFAAGPYVALGLLGNAKMEMSFMGESESDSEDIEWGEDGLNRFDAGVIGGFGVEFGQLQIGAQYGWGLFNILNGGDSDNKISNGVLSFTMAYRIGG